SRQLRGTGSGSLGRGWHRRRVVVDDLPVVAVLHIGEAVAGRNRCGHPPLLHHPIFPHAASGQYTTTLLMLLPSCISSNPLLMSGSGMVCVIIGSISILTSMYQSTIFGTSVRPRAPPKAVPFQTRPVTSWNGRVAISVPAGATPMMMDWPQPRWLASSAWRITVTLP